MNNFVCATPSKQHLKQLISIATLALLLTGCQTTMQQVSDCKVGDWVAIGNKDGHAGLIQKLDERKAFCSSYTKDGGKTDTATNYQSGWEQGNWDLWSDTGRNDGRAALPASQLETHVTQIPKGHAPANRPAYDAGWLTGNTEHWRDVGTRVGSAGMSLAQKDASRTEAATRQIRFDEVAYENGWQAGNLTYWQNAGFEDASFWARLMPALPTRVPTSRQCSVLPVSHPRHRQAIGWRLTPRGSVSHASPVGRRAGCASIIASCVRP